MTKQILMTGIGAAVGIVAGMVVMMMLHMASTLVYPLPDGVDFMAQDAENQTRLKEWFRSLPTGAFLLAIASHGLGCMAGACVAMLASQRRSIVPAIIVGVFFTVGGIMNLSSIPHPAWFPLVDLPIYAILALLAGFRLRKQKQPHGELPALAVSGD
ncbi:hypothetical protein [Neorhodopirellula lusitana]|uniref:hypothetical protein n=1 Tax=Neorhodopirellula lusitana TaxID=445327 RepID=UPI00384BA78B